MTIDAKGYATTPELVWRYPPADMPPKGVKLQLLTIGGIATHGEWRWDGGFLGWQYLPKRNFTLEAEAIEYMQNGAR